jgi:hypothetical protein
MSETACTIGPADPTDTGTVVATSSTRTIGEQCDDVLTTFCARLPGCAIDVSIQDCLGNFEPLCCEGSTCSELSTVSESTVDSCKEDIDTEDCSVVNDDTQNPAACLSQ